MKSQEGQPVREERPAAWLTRRRALVLLLAILALAAALRFFRIGDKSLWIDEVASARLATMPTVVDTVREAAGYDAHPPLFAIVHSFWMRLGHSDGMARVPSAVFGILAAAFVYLLAARLYGRPTGLVAALLMSVSTFDIYYSQEARNYSMIIMLALILTWLLVIIVQSGDRVPGWVWFAYAATGAACLYTLAVSILVIVSHWVVFLLLAKKTRRNLLCGLCAQAAIGLSFLPWLPMQIHAQAIINQIAAEQHALPPPSPLELLGAFGQWTIAPEFILGVKTSDIAPAFGGVVLAIMLFAFLRSRKNPKAVIASACLVFVPIIAYVLLPMKRVYEFDPKHLAFVQPVCLMVIASLFCRVPAGAARLRGVAVTVPLLIVLANLILLPFYYDRGEQKERWPEAARYIETMPDVSVIVISPSRGAPHALHWYYRGRARIEVPEFVPGKAPDAARLPDRIWFVQSWDEGLYPQPQVRNWIEAHFTREQWQLFLGSPGRAILCALYRKKPPDESGTPPAAPAASTPAVPASK